MNKKVFMTAIVCMLLMTGCGKATGSSVTDQASIQSEVAVGSVENSENLISQLTSEKGILEESYVAQAGTESDVSSTEGVDIDLTGLSSVMVYAEVYNMMYSPEEYRGKTVRISGEYYKSYYDETDMDYHFVIISDALACCESGMEFAIKDDRISYPTDGDIVEVTGVFDSYEELGQIYYYLVVDAVTIL